MAAEKQQTSIFEFSYKSVNTSLAKLIKIKVIFILRQGMLKNTKSVKSVTLVTHIRAFPAAGSEVSRHGKAWKFKRPLSQNDREPFRTEVFL